MSIKIKGPVNVYSHFKIRSYLIERLGILMNSINIVIPNTLTKVSIFYWCIQFISKRSMPVVLF